MRSLISRFIETVDQWFEAAGLVAHHAEIVEKRKKRESDPFRHFLVNAQSNLENNRRKLLDAGRELPEALEAANIDSTGVLRIFDAVEHRRGHQTLLGVWSETKAALQRVIIKPIKNGRIKRGTKTKKTRKVDVAITLVVRNPELDDAKIAKQAGCNRSYLSRSKEYQKNADLARRAMVRQQKQAGFDARTGNPYTVTNDPEVDC